MKRSVYEAIVRDIESRNEWDFDNHLEDLQKKFKDENPDTLRSILSQRYQKRVKVMAKHFNTAHKKKEICSKYQKMKKKNKIPSNPGIIVRMAKEENYSPVLLSKIILEDYLTKGKSAKQKQESMKEVKDYLKNSALIPDRLLAHEVHVATYWDDLYGSSAEAIKHSIGFEHEQLLKKKLDNLGISYQDEKEARKAGYDKTPDIKLDIPFAVNGNVVNWIESRALFGDEENHANYLRDQLRPYWNRFGPGMVIYWFGFIDEISMIKKHEGITVSYRFPEDIVFLDPRNGMLPLEILDLPDEEDQGSNDGGHDDFWDNVEDEDNLQEDLRALDKQFFLDNGGREEDYDPDREDPELMARLERAALEVNGKI